MAGGVLETDVGALVPLVRGFFAWWGSELAELARPLLRERHLDGAATVAVASADGGHLLYRQGRAEGLADPRRPVRAALALPPEATLARAVPTPGLSERDWRRIIANDIGRLTPFEAPAVYFAQRFATGPGGERRAELVAVRRPAAEAALARALEDGVRVDALLAQGSDGAPVDLLPALRAGGGAGGRSGRTRGWWGLVALLVGLNLTAATWRDMRDTDRLRAMVERQQPVMDQLQRLRRQVAGEAERRRRLLDARETTSPLRVLDAASAALPDGAWVQRLTLDGGRVRLGGYRRAGLDVGAALQASPAFGDVRAASADLLAAAPDPAATDPAGLAGAGAGAATEAFDLSAAVRPPAVRTGAP